MLDILYETVKPYVVGTIKGFGAGAVAAGVGYMKAEGEDFDGVKFTKTVMLGGAVGALGQGFGIAPKTAEDYLAYPFVVYVIDAVSKAVWRRALGPVVNKIRGLLEE